MASLEESLKKFNNLPLEIVLTVDSKQVVSKMNEINTKYDINVSPLIVFITTGDLKVSDIPRYLEAEFLLDKIKSEEASKEIEEKIINPLKKRINFLNSNPNKKAITLEGEKSIVLEIFKKSLIEELNQHPIISVAVNYRIFHILNKDLDFKKTLEKALYDNNEKLTFKRFELEGKTTRPTIGNWLKDFISQKGSGFFDNIVLSQYITESKNAEKLEEKERNELKKLLKLYRNLKFFPESMPSDDGSGWEMLPVYVKETDKIERDASIDQEDEKEEPEPPSAEATAGKAEKELKIEELEKKSKTYPEGRLERKALEEEIEKMRKSA